MEIVLSFLISVMAEVISHLICKWLETSPSALGDPPREALTPFLEEMVVGLVQRQSGQAKLDKVNVITNLIKNQELQLLFFCANMDLYYHFLVNYTIQGFILISILIFLLASLDR